MGSRFAGSWDKIDRAKQHVRELDRKMADYRKRKPYKVVVKQDPKSPNHLWTLRIREEVPSCLALIMGDAIHNLRSAIDIAIYRSVVLNGTPTPHKMTAFPFPGENESLEAAINRRHVHDAGEDVVGIVRGLEPQMKKGQWLRATHDLDIRDKHHMILLVGSYAGLPDIRDGRLQILNVTVAPVHDGQVLLALSPISHIKLGQEFDAAVQIEMPQGGFAEYEAVVPTLFQLVELVEGIVQTFDALPPFP
jgi:hypothetical protein